MSTLLLTLVLCGVSPTAAASPPMVDPADGSVTDDEAQAPGSTSDTMIGAAVLEGAVAGALTIAMYGGAVVGAAFIPTIMVPGALGTVLAFAVIGGAAVLPLLLSASFLVVFAVTAAIGIGPGRAITVGAAGALLLSTLLGGATVLAALSAGSFVWANVPPAGAPALPYISIASATGVGALALYAASPLIVALVLGGAPLILRGFPDVDRCLPRQDIAFVASVCGE